MTPAHPHISGTDNSPEGLLRAWAKVLDIPSGRFVNEDLEHAADVIVALRARIAARPPIFPTEPGAARDAVAKLIFDARFAHEPRAWHRDWRELDEGAKDIWRRCADAVSAPAPTEPKDDIIDEEAQAAGVLGLMGAATISLTEPEAEEHARELRETILAGIDWNGHLYREIEARADKAIAAALRQSADSAREKGRMDGLREAANHLLAEAQREGNDEAAHTLRRASEVIAALRGSRRVPRLGIFVSGVPLAECSPEVQKEVLASEERRKQGGLVNSPPRTNRPPADTRTLAAELGKGTPYEEALRIAQEAAARPPHPDPAEEIAHSPTCQRQACTEALQLAVAAAAEEIARLTKVAREAEAVLRLISVDAGSYGEAMRARDAAEKIADALVGSSPARGEGK
jgi:hypothetical protein